MQYWCGRLTRIEAFLFYFPKSNSLRLTRVAHSGGISVVFQIPEESEILSVISHRLWRQAQFRWRDLFSYEKLFKYIYISVYAQCFEERLHCNLLRIWELPIKSIIDVAGLKTMTDPLLRICRKYSTARMSHLRSERAKRQRSAKQSIKME